MKKKEMNKIIGMPLMKRLQAISLFQKITDLRPKWATGVHVTKHGVSFSRRTKPRNFPENFMLLWPKEEKK